MENLFGTDGVRGTYGVELTDKLAKQLGYYGTKVLTNSHKPLIVIGTDTRVSANALERALCEGISLAGGKALLLGVIPTPAVAVIVRALGADAGIVISASHNPYEDNGIKFFNSEGFKLSDAIEEEISRSIIEETEELGDAPELNAEVVGDAKDIYLDFLFGEEHKSLKGKRVALDCANGASSEVAPEYFRRLGAEVTVIGDNPDGFNINQDCGSTSMASLQNLVLATGADFGFAFDGDADRCLGVDEKGNVIDGDTILSLIARKMRGEGNLPDDTIVVTVMSNLGLKENLTSCGISCEVTQVGDRYVLERMLEKGYKLGGEQSGHIIRLDRNSTGDGLLTASTLADIFMDSDKSASELNSQIVPYPQVLANAQVNNDRKYSYESDPVILNKIREIEEFFEGRGRVLVRPSGTEPLVRVMIEGKMSYNEVLNLAKETADLIEERLSL